jgi:hypothetical protein
MERLSQYLPWPQLDRPGAVVVGENDGVEVDQAAEKVQGGSEGNAGRQNGYRRVNLMLHTNTTSRPVYVCAMKAGPLSPQIRASTLGDIVRLRVLEERERANRVDPSSCLSRRDQRVRLRSELGG